MHGKNSDDHSAPSPPVLYLGDLDNCLKKKQNKEKLKSQKKMKKFKFQKKTKNFLKQ